MLLYLYFLDIMFKSETAVSFNTLRDGPPFLKERGGECWEIAPKNSWTAKIARINRTWAFYYSGTGFWCQKITAHTIDAKNVMQNADTCPGKLSNLCLTNYANDV